MTLLAVTGLGTGVAATTLGFGFRHGIDWDHLAALTDLTSAQPSARRAMRMATLYAVGHALVVFALGIAAIAFAEELPGSVDSVMSRVVGATLIALGLYVTAGLLRHGRQFRMQSRWMLVLGGAGRIIRRLRRRNPDLVVIEHEHEHDHHAGMHAHTHADDGEGSGKNVGIAHRHVHRHVAQLPADPFPQRGALAALAIGMLHGIGAETPTQVVLFVTAAGAAGPGAGIALLVCFVAGLLASNTLIAAAGTAGILSASRNWPVYLTVSIAIAAGSLVIGSLFLAGHDAALPSLFGG